MAFISRFEEWCPTVAHLQHLRSHPTYVTFTKRFQLPVYYQLRFKEIATSVERALDVGSASGGGDVFVMSESDAVWRGISTCWSNDVWLEELAGRFWRLTLQVSSVLSMKAEFCTYPMLLDHTVAQSISDLDQ